MINGYIMLFSLTLASIGDTKVSLAPYLGEYSEYPLNCTRSENITRQYGVAEVKAVLKQHNVTSAWLPLKRKEFKMWTWMNGEDYVEHISDPGWVIGGYDCGLLRAGDKIIDDVPCRQLLRHFLCEARDRNCSHITGGSSCFTHNQKAYVTYSSSKHKYTWYAAKQQCHENKMSLASFKKSEREQLMEKVSFTMGVYDKLWLGLRKMEYQFESSVHGYSEIYSFNWAAESPCPCPNLECVTVRQDGMWKAENCTAEHGFLCIAKTEYKGKGPKIKENNTKASPVNVPAIIVSLIAAAIIIFILVILVVFRKKIYEKYLLLRGSQQKKEPAEGSSSQRIPLQAVEQPLLNNPHRLPAVSFSPRRLFKKKGPELPADVPLTENAKLLIEKYLKNNQFLEKTINILLIGLPGAGKSSLINSLMACVQKEGYIEWCTTGSFGDHGHAGRSAITQQLSCFRLFHHLENETPKPEEVSYKCRPTLWDCPGLMDDSSEKTKYILDRLLTGSLKPGTKINVLLNMGEKKLRKKKFHPDESRRINIILLVHAADSTAYPGNLMGAVLDTTKKYERDVPVFFIITKKDVVKKTKHQQILQDASAKVGLHKNVFRTEVVSCYSESTMITGKNRTPKIDDKMCVLWSKLLNPGLHSNKPVEIESYLSDENSDDDDDDVDAEAPAVAKEILENQQTAKSKLED